MAPTAGALLALRETTLAYWSSHVPSSDAILSADSGPDGLNPINATKRRSSNMVKEIQYRNKNGFDCCRHSRGICLLRSHMTPDEQLLLLQPASHLVICVTIPSLQYAVGLTAAAATQAPSQTRSTTSPEQRTDNRLRDTAGRAQPHHWQRARAGLRLEFRANHTQVELARIAQQLRLAGSDRRTSGGSVRVRLALGSPTAAVKVTRTVKFKLLSGSDMMMTRNKT